MTQPVLSFFSIAKSDSLLTRRWRIREIDEQLERCRVVDEVGGLLGKVTGNLLPSTYVCMDMLRGTVSSAVASWLHEVGVVEQLFVATILAHSWPSAFEMGELSSF